MKNGLNHLRKIIRTLIIVVNRLEHNHGDNAPCLHMLNSTAIAIHSREHFLKKKNSQYEHVLYR